MWLVLSSYHGRRCISIRVIAAGTSFFSMVHVCLWVCRRRRYLFSCRCRWCFSYFGAADFCFFDPWQQPVFTYWPQVFSFFEVVGGVFICFLCRRSFVLLQMAFLMNATLPGTSAISKLPP